MSEEKVTVNRYEYDRLRQIEGKMKAIRSILLDQDLGGINIDVLRAIVKEDCNVQLPM